MAGAGVRTSGRGRPSTPRVNEHVGDGPAVEQLWFGAGLGHGLCTKQPGDYSQGSRKSRRREPERREKQTRQADRRLSPHFVARLGIDAPLLEADVRAVAVLGPNWSGRRVAAFLDQRGLLVPMERTDPEQAALERLLQGVPDQLRDEADAWVRVLRGEGRKPSLTMNWVTIRRYAHFDVPALQQWGQRVSSSVSSPGRSASTGCSVRHTKLPTPCT